MSTSSDQRSQPAPPPGGTPATREMPVVPATSAAQDETPLGARPATGGAHLPPPRAAGPEHRPPAPPTADAPPVPAPPVPAPPVPAQPTGPVDFVPGIPGAGIVPPAPIPPVPASPQGPAESSPPQDSAGSSVDPPDAGATAAPAWPETLESRNRTGRAARHVPRPRDRQAAAGLSLAALAVVLLQVGLSVGWGTESWWSTVTLWSAFATLCAVVGFGAVALLSSAHSGPHPAMGRRAAVAGFVGLSMFWVLVALPAVASDRGFVLTAALACLGAALWICSSGGADRKADGEG